MALRHACQAYIGWLDLIKMNQVWAHKGTSSLIFGAYIKIGNICIINWLINIRDIKRRIDVFEVSIVF